MVLNNIEARDEQRVPVTVLNGFLGSGKTTLLQGLLAKAVTGSPPLRPAVIVNDMSELDVDGIVIEGTEVVSPAQGNFVSISGGSIHGGEQLPALLRGIDHVLDEGGPEHVFIETSGSTRPWPIVAALRDHPRVRLHGFLSLVDAAMLRDDYALAAGLSESIARQLEDGERGIELLMAEQIMFATHVLLSKVDRVSPDELRRVARNLHPINPSIPIAGVHYGNLALDDVLRVPPYDHDRVALLIEEMATFDEEHPDDAHIVSLVLDSARPFHPERLWSAYTTELPATLYRSKGTTWLPTRDDRVLLWNQASGGINLSFLGYWKAGVVAHDEDRLLAREREALGELARRIDPVFGDRRTRITLIGAERESRAFYHVLESCLLTDAEVAAWQRGDAFRDPWPDNAVLFDAGS